ncbi:hypothetical protein XENOCAPTIV_008267 [Xenoophorus captivus]|uniref:Uncharacterized protein n=1 Tax=Xenoophorus captivus TaxID=1517983 RepID=A0ABV0R7M3_9TELE
MERLEEARAEAKNTESNHKRAIQLLQTELLDSRVLVKEKENAILTLRVNLEESEKKASPSAAELENLRSKLFEMEVKFASVTDEHHQELERMKMVLSVKEESLRKLKQDLRSHQKSEESCRRLDAIQCIRLQQGQITTCSFSQVRSFMLD